MVEPHARFSVGRRRRRWRRPIRLRDGAGTLRKSLRFTVLTQPESGFFVYGYGDSDDPGFPAPGAGAGEGLRPFDPPRQARAPAEFAGGGLTPRTPWPRSRRRSLAFPQDTWSGAIQMM